MTKTYTEQAFDKIERQIAIAKKDGSGGTRGIRITIDKNGNPRFQHDGKRISQDIAMTHIAAQLEREDAPQGSPNAVQRTGFAWDKLNANTQGFFQEICEEMLTATRDASLSVAVRLGHDIPKIAAANQPRLTNLKKANLLESVAGEKKSHKMLRLTDLGRAQAQALNVI